MVLLRWSKVTHQVCEGIMTGPPVPGVCDLLSFKDALAIVLFRLNSTLKSHLFRRPPAVSRLDRPHICYGFKTQHGTSDECEKLSLWDVWKKKNKLQNASQKRRQWEVVNNGGQQRPNIIPHCLKFSPTVYSIKPNIWLKDHKYFSRIWQTHNHLPSLVSQLTITECSGQKLIRNLITRQSASLILQQKDRISFACKHSNVSQMLGNNEIQMHEPDSRNWPWRSSPTAMKNCMTTCFHNCLSQCAKQQVNFASHFLTNNKSLNAESTNSVIKNRWSQ